MRKCIRNGNVLAFSLGLLVSCIFPECWLIAIIAIVLAVTAVVGSGCCR